jgi:arylsulfatase A-like enzyme
MADNTRLMARIMGRDSARPVYAAVVDGMDQAIGRVLETLDKEGLADNTIVLFFSDNGGAVYAIGGADNAPLRGGKGDAFEGGIRVVATVRWPDQISAGSRVDSIMSVMDVLPTLAAAANIPASTHYRLDGQNMLPAIINGEAIPRDELLFFIAESPFKNTVNVTAFNDEWKLVQRIETGFTAVEVQNFLFDINEDPNELQNLAQAHPDVVQNLAGEIRLWRNLYPVAGTRSELMPPPGWRAPLDWANYPQQSSELQPNPSGGMPPENAIRMLDWQYGENGRLIYNCEPYRWAGGGLCKRQ